LGESVEDYSDYSRHITTIMNGLTLIEGFIYTAITLLLTRLNQASAIYFQILLLLLIILFYLNGLLVQHLSAETLYYCRKLPPRTRRISFRTGLMFVIYAFFGLSIPIMLLIFDLTFLSIVSTVIWFLNTVAVFVISYKPMTEFRKQRQ
jgi:hypothetical protein